MRILLLAASALALSIGTSSVEAQGRGGGGGPKAERGQGGGGGGPRAERGNRGGGGGPQMRQGGGGNGKAARGGGRGQERQMVRGGGRGQERQMAGGGGRGQERKMAGGGGRGPDRQEARGGGRGQERQAARVQQRGPEREARGNGNGRGNGQMRAAEQRGRGQEQMRGGGGNENGGRGNAQAQGQQQFAAPREQRERQSARLTQRRAAQVASAGEIARLNWEPSRGLIDGCPPGLARKYNGCMPPGQLRQQLAQQQTWFDDWWSYPQSTNYIYDEGYLYSLDGNSIDSYAPLLGGALWTGSTWPEDYQSSPVQDYHVDYFGLSNDNYDYQLGDGAIYGVDPNTQLIQQIGALIAGDEWGLGQQMPQGYDVYNVPYEFRDQYQDTPDAMYRYSDGYVYQVDPTSQLIQAAIQLIS